jgi:hypothetical protein
MKVLLAITLFTLSFHGLADSLEEISRDFPEAVETETIIDHGPRNFSKQIGPKTKEIKRVNYDVLIPLLLKRIQENEAEIKKLKAQS